MNARRCGGACASGCPVLPAAPAETAAAEGDKAAAEAESAGAQKAENEPVLNEATAAKGGQKSTGGEAAPVSQ